VRLLPFLALSPAPDSTYYLAASSPLVICRFDPARTVLTGSFEVWVEAPGESSRRLEIANDMKVDSRGRMLMLSRGEDGKPLLSQLRDLEGGDAP
jgi:hypothetical protein